MTIPKYEKMGIDKHILSRRISDDNTWWLDGEIPFYRELSKRRYYFGFYDLVLQDFPHRAVVLMGPRRIGKTVFIYQAIQDLIQISKNFQNVRWAVEIKWSDNPKAGKLKQFMSKNNLDKGIITSRTKFEDYQDLLIVPNRIYAYVVSKNALSNLDVEIVNLG